MSFSFRNADEQGHHGLHPGTFRGRQHVAAIVVLVLLAFGAFRVFPGYDVLVLNDGRAVHVRATFEQPGEALEAARVSLEPGDEVIVAGNSGQGSLAVRRARTVIVSVDGRMLAVDTQASTVSGALAAAGVELGPGDVIEANGRAMTERTPLEQIQAERTTVRASAATSDVTPLLNVVRARPITIVIGDTRLVERSAAETVGEALESIGILVREADIVTPSLDNEIQANAVIEISAAHFVSLVLNGQPRTMYTHAGTVAGLLAVLEIEPGAEDIIEPAPATALEDGATITIALTRTVDEVVEVPISPPVVYESDPSLAEGELRVVEGTPGVRQVTFRVTYKNGQEVAREEAPGAVVLREAAPTRYITGTAKKPAVPVAAPPPANSGGGDSGSGFNGTYQETVTVLATWYNATHGGKTRDDPWFGYTATGAKLDYGICATDPNYIPLGSVMYVPGYGTCIAADIGGGVKGWHIDLGFPESAGSNPWGTKTLDIYIIEWG